MTDCAIRTLRCTTEHPFELIIVEAGRNGKYDGHQLEQYSDRYIFFDNPTGSPNAEANAGIEAATGDFIVYTGNDVFTRPGWLEAMLQCFEFKDCGAATVIASELKMVPGDYIQEGVYGPFMMFRKGWLFDASRFPCQFGDTDLIMRMYGEGLRSYRNYRVVIHHLNRQTLSDESNNEDYRKAKQRFIDRHGKSPLLMRRILIDGNII